MDSNILEDTDYRYYDVHDDLESYGVHDDLESYGVHTAETSFDEKCPHANGGNIIAWDREIDFTGFSENALDKFFPSFDKSKPKEHEERRLTLWDFYSKLGLCLYDLFPYSVDTYQIPTRISTLFRNVEVEFTDGREYHLGSKIKGFEYIQYKKEGELKNKRRWFDVSDTEIINAVQSGRMYINPDIRAISTPSKPFKKQSDHHAKISGSNWKGIFIFECDSETLHKNTVLPLGYEVDDFIVDFKPEKKSVTWTDETTNFESLLSEITSLDIITDEYSERFGALPKIEIDPITRQPKINVDTASWHYKCRHNFDRWYPFYLQSGEWYLVRQTILNLSNSRCAMEGCHSKATQIHHKHYRNVGQEEISDLMAVCANCHRRIHKKLKTLNDAKITEIQHIRQLESKNQTNTNPLGQQLRLRF